MLKTCDLVQRFRSLYLRGNPTSYARMNRPNAYSKYTKVLDPLNRAPLAITDKAIAQHLAGTATYAAPLIGADGFTREAALDIDQGGEAAVQCALNIADELGYAAYGLVSRPVSGGHHGGHIRIPLSSVAAPERARLLASHIQQSVASRCGLPESAIEVYPTYKGLRLPFGVHTHTGVRGALLLQGGTRLELDVGEPLATIHHAITILEALPANDADNLPTLPAPPAAGPAVNSPGARQTGNSSSLIQDYNQHTNLLDWLIALGARVAAPTSAGGYLLCCPCSNHKHHDTRPSLELQPARNPRHGIYVLIGHAPGCLFATERGRIVNAFDAYCRWFGLSTPEASKRLLNSQHSHKM